MSRNLVKRLVPLFDRVLVEKIKPPHTNALIARANAPEIPDERWFSMVRLDQNRARTQLAQRAGVPVSAVRTVAIWGNHSSTQVPDYWHATIEGKPATSVIDDPAWFDAEFIPTVQQRGAAIIRARGASSAASAANAVIDSVRSVINPTPSDDWDALAVVSKGEYGVPEGIFFGFPVRSNGSVVEVVEGLDISEPLAARIAITRDELLSERAEVSDLLS
jgi:malate dehydrogenase